MVLVLKSRVDESTMGEGRGDEMLFRYFVVRAGSILLEGS